MSRSDPAWVVNRTLTGTGTTDPLLRRRIAGKADRVAQIGERTSRRLFAVPFCTGPPVGIARLLALTFLVLRAGGVLVTIDGTRGLAALKSSGLEVAVAIATLDRLNRRLRRVVERGNASLGISLRFLVSP